MEVEKRSNVETVVLIVMLLAVALGVGVTFLIKQADKYAQTSPAMLAENYTSRENYRQALIGKTQGHIIAMLGQPERKEFGSEDRTWYYRNPPTSRYPGAQRDIVVMLSFYESRVIRVSF